jgi:hypothetical protein
MAYRLFCAILLLPAIVSCKEAPQALTSWDACLGRQIPDPSVRICGVLEALSNVRDTQDFSSQVRHDLPLDRLFHQPGQYAFEGSLSRLGAVWHLQLGVAQPKDPRAIAVQSDDGSVVARLSPSGDSLVGTWSRTCFMEECPESGSITLRPLRAPNVAEST